MTGMDAQRAMLDELMGANRNLDNPDAEIDDYRDRRVCTHFLLGCCPHEVFKGTKVDLGPCERAHSDDLKAQFEAAVAEGGSDVRREVEDYERELERALRDVIQEADRKIQRGIRVRACVYCVYRFIFLEGKCRTGADLFD